MYYKTVDFFPSNQRIFEINMEQLKKYNTFTVDSVSYCDYYWMKNKDYRYKENKLNVRIYNIRPILCVTPA